MRQAAPHEQSITSVIMTTPCGIVVERTSHELDFWNGIDFLIDRLDEENGVYLASGVADPDRYSRWDIAFVGPPLEFVAMGEDVVVRALNPSGEALLEVLLPAFVDRSAFDIVENGRRQLRLRVRATTRSFREEDRSLQATVFSPLRRVIEELSGSDDAFLGLYGAFGYDLLFQFEQIDLTHPRTERDKTFHLFLPDQIYSMDRRKERAFRFDYAFSRGTLRTRGASRIYFTPPVQAARKESVRGALDIVSDHSADSYAKLVDRAREGMRAGDIFEIVLSRTFTTPFSKQPSILFRALNRINPSPYEFFCQFGDEQLVGASPEMFVRVEGDRVESCPISGTIGRGENAIEDAERIRELYNSEKDEVELTMCTDVDRNDKSRICRPGTIELLGRRLIERYAGLFHTVDHVVGRLRPELTGVDAFMSHMWAVTLTGAPKKMAAQLIEEMENSSRGWYGGAVGALLFNGGVNTGITIRTAHLRDGSARYRVGATLVYDSIGHEEERETRTKANAFFKVVELLNASDEAEAATEMPARQLGVGLRILVIDYEDSFVHTLASYLREDGAEVATYRSGVSLEAILRFDPDLVVHSPGPGAPAKFGIPARIRALAEYGIPQFGVCLGLQGLAEAFGGRLGVLDAPRHGKFWMVSHSGAGLFEGLPNPCRVGAYHSLHALREELPECLEITAANETGLVMGLKHRDLAVEAVQFHPESILSMQAGVGRILIRNLIVCTVEHQRRRRGAVVEERDKAAPLL